MMHEYWRPAPGAVRKPGVWTPETIYQRKLEIILNNLYGVDIDLSR